MFVITIYTVCINHVCYNGVYCTIATCPDFYPHLIELDLHNTLLQLLGHDNGDIAVCVADLLREMLDVDPLHEGTDGADALSQQLLEGQVVSLLVALLAKLDEKNTEEAQGIHNILGKIVNASIQSHRLG